MYTYIHSFLDFLPLRSPHSTEYIIISYQFYTQYIYVYPSLSMHPTPSPPLLSMFVLYVCVSIA